MGNNNLPEIIRPNEQEAEPQKRVAHFLVYPDRQEFYDRDQAINEEILIAAWLRGKAKRTKHYYAREIRNFFSAFPGKTIKAISTTDITLYLARRENLGHRPPSLKLAKDAISSMLSHMAKTGYVAFNPALAVDPIKIKDKIAFKVLSPAQVDRLLGVPDLSLRDRKILEFLFLTGLRVSELVSLTWGAFLPRGEIVQFTVTGKGDKTRSIVIPRERFDSLLQLVDNRIPDGSEPVFKSTQSPCKKLSTTQIWRIVKAAAKLAGLSPTVTTHHLRHTHATHALSNGCPINVLQKNLGHSSLNTTARYLEVYPTESSAMYIKLK